MISYSMATSLAEKINQNFLHCGICLEPFRKPRALPCLHSFCEECLERWTRANTKENIKPSVIVCPNCQKAAAIPLEGIQGFPAHFLVNSLQETLSMEKTTKDYSNKECSKCNKSEIKAHIYCSECAHFLCKSCFDSHSTWLKLNSAWEGLKHHTVIPIDDLASGKVTLSEANTQDQYCTEHEEQRKFYCKTCSKPVCRDCIVMKQHCRDHDYVMLKDTFGERVKQIKELMNECSEKRKQCQEAFQNAKKAKSQLVASAKAAQCTLDKSKKECTKQLEDTFTHQNEQINSTEKDKSDELEKITKNLSDYITQLDSAYQEGQNLTQTLSHVRVISSFPNVHKVLQGANQIHVDENIDGLSGIPTPAMSTCVVSKQWGLSGKIKVPNTEDKQKGPVGIALTSENKMIITYDCHVKVFSRSGNLQHLINHVPCSKEDVTVMSDDQIIFVEYEMEDISILSREYQEAKIKLNHKTMDVTLTVDKNELIIVSSSYEQDTNTSNIISFHKTSGSTRIPSFKAKSSVQSIAALVPGEIAVLYENNSMESIDYSGKSIHTFQPPPVVKTWEPACICCSKKYEVFVVNQGDPKAIYRYTARGEYIGCVTTEITDVRGIAISHDDMELFVTEYSDGLVKIFKRP